MAHPVAVTDATFDQQVVNASGPVLVDFWAPWCGPCRMVAPILDQISDELGEKITIVKVNVDENQQIAGNLGIMSIPTLMLVHHGREIARQSGAVSLSRLLPWAREHADGVKV